LRIRGVIFTRVILYATLYYTRRGGTHRRRTNIIAPNDGIVFSNYSKKLLINVVDILKSGAFGPLPPVVDDIERAVVRDIAEKFGIGVVAEPVFEFFFKIGGGVGPAGHL
jgi:hypothetical protein